MNIKHFKGAKTGSVLNYRYLLILVLIIALLVFVNNLNKQEEIDQDFVGDLMAGLEATSLGIILEGEVNNQALVVDQADLIGAILDDLVNFTYKKAGLVEFTEKTPIYSLHLGPRSQVKKIKLIGQDYISLTYYDENRMNLETMTLKVTWKDGTYDQLRQQLDQALEYSLKPVSTYVYEPVDARLKGFVRPLIKELEDHEGDLKNIRGELVNLDDYTYLGTLSNGDDIYIQPYTYYLVDSSWDTILVREGNPYRRLGYHTSRPVFNTDRTEVLFVDSVGFEMIGNVCLYNSKTDQIFKYTNYGYDGTELTVKKVDWLDEKRFICLIGYPFGTISQGGDLYLLDTGTYDMSPLMPKDFVDAWTQEVFEFVDFSLEEYAMKVTLVKWNDSNMISPYYTREVILLEDLLIPELQVSQGIELRESNHWMDKNNFDHLTLDGRKYVLADDVINRMSSSHMGLHYPLVVIDGREVYDLESQQVLFNLEDLKGALGEVWGSQVAKEAYPWYSDVNLQADDFTMIDHVNYDRESRQVLVSTHAFYADILDSIVGLYDLDQKSFSFIDNPFYGQVYDSIIDDTGRQMAFTYYTGGDYVSYFVSLVNQETMAVKTYNLGQQLEELLDQYDPMTMYLQDITYHFKGQVLVVDGEIHLDNRAVGNFTVQLIH